jgi:uncharacterized protein YbjT (DUF2867 family)
MRETDKMRVLVLGATGRVGSEVTRRASEAGHEVTAFVRDPARLRVQTAHVAVGDIGRPETLAAALSGGIDAVVNAVGADPLKPSTIVTDTARAIVAAMHASGVRRYVAISGTAQMPKTPIGTLSIGILRLTPVGNAIRDHQGAFDIVTASGLDWTHAGCPWIKDGQARGYREHAQFPGGMKSIVPADVAAFLVSVLDQPSYVRRIVGIWP